jgi:2-polyprenyl-3-methyl-5-hydroxy-6-metoxy-1,4-benzoquinol methylase
MKRKFQHPHNPLYLSQPEYFIQQRLEVVQLITELGIRGTRIIELGCATGATAMHLRRALSPERYVGIEIQPEVAEQARVHISEVHVADLNLATPQALGLETDHFDLLVALDVLEHLYNPWDVLGDYSTMLVPYGHAILSIPNVANLQIIQQLASGRWQYQSSGLLDATHIRFFTRATIEELVTGAGLKVLHVRSLLDSQPDIAQATDLGNSLSVGNVRLSNLSKAQATDLCTSQFLVIAQKSGPD